jgi:hypothetical protein
MAICAVFGCSQRMFCEGGRSLSREFFSGRCGLKRRTLESARELVRLAAEKRHGEQQAKAIERAARLLGLSVSMTANIFYGEVDACSEERAKAILTLRPIVLAERLEYEFEMVRKHTEETARILAEMRAEEDRCREKPTAASPKQPCALPSSSAASPDGWLVGLNSDGLVWGHR